MPSSNTSDRHLMGDNEQPGSQDADYLSGNEADLSEDEAEGDEDIDVESDILWFF